MLWPSRFFDADKDGLIDVDEFEFNSNRKILRGENHPTFSKRHELDAITVMTRLLLVICALAVCTIGCGRRERMKLDALEQESAAVIRKFLVFHEIQSPDVPVTNVAQIFGLVDLSRSHRSHPYFLQEQFKQFGERSGFVASLYEKYVVVPRGVASVLVPGQAIFMNAKPFANSEGEMVRIIIWKAGDQDYRIDRIAEVSIRQTFSQNRVKIPAPTPMTPAEAPPGYERPRYSIATRARMFFEELAYVYGPGKFFWFPTMLICIGVPLLGAIVFTLWFARHKR